MRHGEAEHFADSDAERALTKRGKMASLAVAQAANEQGISQFDKVLVSPYLRAQETWLEISQAFSGKKVETCDDITPYGMSDDVFDLTLAMAEVEKLETILFVSHLPLAGYLTARPKILSLVSTNRFSPKPSVTTLVSSTPKPTM